MDVRSLGFRTDLVLRRLAGADVVDRGDYVVVRTPQNPGFYWGNFLLVPPATSPDDARQWLDTFATELPDADHVAIGVDGVDGERGSTAALEAAGLTSEVNTVLVADDLHPPARRPEGVVLRELATDDDLAGAVAVRLAIDERDDPRHVEFVERRIAELHAWAQAGHGVYVGALAAGRVVAALGLYTDGSGIGRFQNVETHSEFRRRGLAAGLLCLAADLLRERHGVRRFVIVADPGYVAVELYRKLGFADAEWQVLWQREPVSRGP